MHASTLRRLLPAGLTLDGRPAGYVLHVGPERLDTERFEALAARGRAALADGDGGSAAALLRAALALWRGGALADVAWERFAGTEVGRWEQLRDTTEDDLVDARMALGGHDDVVPDLEATVERQPFRERRWAQLLTCLYRAGRQAEALDRYRRLHRLLADELGVAPAPALQALHAAILRHDAALAGAPSGAPPWARFAPGSPVGAGPPGGTPVTHFARGPAGRIAYQVLGAGPPTLVFIPGFGGNVELRWEEPNLSRLYRRLARRVRLVLFDKRGTGCRIATRASRPPKVTSTTCWP